MDRKIKFRIWDNEEKKFFTPIYEAYKGNLLDISISLSGELLRRSLEHCSEHESKFPDRYRINQQWEPSKGVIVFTNDLVEVECSPSGVKTIKKRIVRIGSCGTGMYASIWYRKEFWAYNSINWTTAKVVGNMYQDHERLLN